MSDINVSLAAVALLKARETGETIPTLPEGSHPRNTEDAYAIQDAIMLSLGEVAGWKVGAKNPQSEPTCSPLPQTLICDSPGKISVQRAQLHGVEIEIAVRLGKDLPPVGQPYTAEDVIAVVESVHPAIEIVCSRFTNPWQLDEMFPLADSISNGYLIVGPGISNTSALAGSTAGINMTLDGKSALSDEKSNPGGTIGRLLAWLANHAAARSGGLRKGQIITTGSFIGIFPIPATVAIQGDVRNVGSVEVMVTEVA